MAQDDAYRRLAEAELARHRNDLLYADRQSLKKGEYEAVAARLRRPKWVALCAVGAMAVVMVVVGDTMNRILALVIVGQAAYHYVQVKRTQEFIERLTREKASLVGGGPKGEA